MTLRDFGTWLAADLNSIFTENILDWPIWSFFVIIFILIPLSLKGLSHIIDDQRRSKSVGARPMVCFAIGSIFTGIGNIELWFTRFLFHGDSWIITAMRISYIAMFIVFTSAALIEYGKWRNART